MNKQALQDPSVEIGSKTVSLNAMYPIIKEVLDNGGTFSLTITGSSMYPFILGGRDQVTLSPVPKKLKKNDLPLYRRKSGQFVLHRIVKVCKDGTYTCCGDHQWQLEKGLTHDQMVGLATSYVRKGKVLTNQNILYRVYRTVWTWLLKFRWIFFGIQNRLHRWFKR